MQPKEKKITKYYCNMEKRHFVSKQMFKLVGTNGITITDTNEMVEETRRFYEQLYKKKETTNVDINDFVQTLPKLNTTKAEELEGIISYDEASQALKT